MSYGAIELELGYRVSLISAVAAALVRDTRQMHWRAAHVDVEQLRNTLYEVTELVKVLAASPVVPPARYLPDERPPVGETAGGQRPSGRHNDHQGDVDGPAVTT